MKINLKQLHYQINTLDMVIGDLKNKRFVGTTGATVNDMKALLELVSDIEKDLKLSGESVTELDMPREEANKQAYGR